MQSHPADVTAAPDATNDASPVALFAAIAVLMAVDALTDVLAGAKVAHVAVETAVFVLAAAGLALLVKRERKLHRRTLAAAKEEAAKWRSESRAVLAGLGAAIDRQFEAWQLSPAEREVGLLLLKGLSLKEVAEARGTSERTVRQQALALYRKAGLAGRAELSAFFLEDLLLPESRDAS